ncbi:MAG: radical SAM protein [Smithellaceae bacterium]|nr:radical SAM protein [Syntrophaceae bacterium]MDD4241600.1 radical SAM protein [Smithellaceae bacterium]NLX50600.1 radical SAM protein [Deltaproteobacteria bacterium]
MPTYEYIYGPVPSRRLGRSLGLDLVPYKTCTYDCIYCQLGKTTEKTLERREYVPVADVLKELHEKLSTGIDCDYISLAGSGEPTLHAGTGELIAKIKEMTKIPVAVITNGSLLYRPEVREALAGADLVIPSLDAGDAALFEYVNRPHPDISFETMAEGLITFAGQYKGRLWLEVLLVSGVTGLPLEARKIAAWIDKIRPERVQLGTVNRPAPEDFACAVDPKQMKTLVGCFAKNVDLLENTPPAGFADAGSSDATDNDIMNLLARRPCALEGLCAGLGLHPHDAVKRIERMIAGKSVVAKRNGRTIYYTPAERAS